MIILSKSKIPIKLILLVFLTFLYLFIQVQANCKSGCRLAFASYYVWEGSNLTYISTIFNLQISEILSYNPHVSSPDKIDTGTRINVPFSCDCLNGDFLGHTFSYFTQSGDTYDKIANNFYANLTTEDWVRRVNVYDATQIPTNGTINVTVNCSCGDRQVSRDYGLFSTYPLRSGENLSFISAESNVSAELLRRYNPRSNFSAGTGLVFVPAKDIRQKHVAIVAAGHCTRVCVCVSPNSFLNTQLSWPPGLVNTVFVIQSFDTFSYSNYGWVLALCLVVGR